MRSRAQVSEQKTGAPSRRPITRGRKPQGSRAATRRLSGQEEQGEGPHHLGEAGRERVLQALAMRAGVEVEDDLGVGGGLEDGARRLQLVAELAGVGQVAVVGHRDGPPMAVDEIGLGVSGHGVARGRVPRVADGPVALDRVQGGLVEHVVHEAHALVHAQPPAVAAADDPRRFLAPVLLGVEAEVGEVGGLRMAVDPEERAAIVEAVVVERSQAVTAETRTRRRGHREPDVSRSVALSSVRLLAEELADSFLGRLRGQGDPEPLHEVDLRRGRGAA